MKRFILIATMTVVSLLVLLTLAIEAINTPPRLLSPYIVYRTSGHNPLIVRLGVWLGDKLISLDRGNLKIEGDKDWPIGGQNVASTYEANAKGTLIPVNTSEAAIKAISQARPGDIITFQPGTYRFNGSSIAVSREATAAEHITVRAQKAGTVLLELNMAEGFFVTAPYWTFENLTIRGVCEIHSNCDHAFHIVGSASNFVARNNTIFDFNAHFKINGINGRFPDFGIIEGNSLSNSSVRLTDHPVTLIDLVAASNWAIRRNWISDFAKAYSNQISYGAFAKGAGTNNVFEQNIVICEHKLRGVKGQRVGLSLGGGGTGKEYCRDKRCITEQDSGVIQSNLIASCSDEGIYVNRAATSKIFHNTLIDTAGITVRFSESSADVEGNMVDGLIRSRDDGLLRANDNLATSSTLLYAGLHPTRKYFKNAQDMDFTWRTTPPMRFTNTSSTSDLCGVTRQSPTPYGAVIDFSACQHTEK